MGKKQRKTREKFDLWEEIKDTLRSIFVVFFD